MGAYTFLPLKVSDLLLREKIDMTIAKIQVLIVVKEAIVSMDLRYKLEAMGYCVPAEISSGKEAVERASQLHPDVVLMDMGLSGDLDGNGTAEEIRRRFNIPVVYLADSVDEAQSARAKTNDLSGYLIMPFDNAMLAM